MIPQTIHYAWFGKNPKPPLIQRCIESWRRHLPAYSITEWNEDNFDVNTCPFTSLAYSSQKWAFLSDYVRLYALYHYGGIYLDADVEVIQPLDKFLRHRAFTGHETTELMLAATMGAEQQHPWIGMLLEYYHAARFMLRPNTRVITELSKSWIERQNYGFTYLREGVVIYPVDVFTPFDHQRMTPMPTEHTHCIHHFAGSWLGRPQDRL